MKTQFCDNWLFNAHDCGVENKVPARTYNWANVKVCELVFFCSCCFFQRVMWECDPIWIFLFQCFPKIICRCLFEVIVLWCELNFIWLYVNVCNRFWFSFFSSYICIDLSFSPSHLTFDSQIYFTCNTHFPLWISLLDSKHPFKFWLRCAFYFKHLSFNIHYTECRFIFHPSSPRSHSTKNAIQLFNCLLFSPLFGCWISVCVCVCVG